MKDTFRIKLEQLSRRLVEVESLLSDPAVTNDMNRYRALSRERSDIEPISALFAQFQAREADAVGAQEMLADPEMRDMAQEEIDTAKADIERIEKELTLALLPKDPADERNIFLEIRAGTGGDESALFAGDLLRMYTRFAERQRWQVEIVSSNESELGGYREVIARIVGQGAYSKLKFESGTHRVQRVPATEAQGRIHTSACTVAILPEADPIKDITINPADLRIDTFRASGAGGQHINKTCTSRPASLSSAKMVARSIKTKHARLKCSPHVFWNANAKPRTPKKRGCANRSSARVTEASAFVPTTTHRAA